MRRRFPILLLAFCAGIALLHAQQPPGQPGGRRHSGPPEGKWWYNPSLVQRLGVTKDQQRKIEDTFQQNRLKLIDLTAALEREQAVLDSLLAADHPQESRILAQFDRAAEARLELEKANARMLWRFRTALSSDQWKELQSQDAGRNPGPTDCGTNR